jgi:hypothetical protein
LDLTIRTSILKEAMMDLLEGVIGGGNVANIDGRRYRRILVRNRLLHVGDHRTALWIGMNPSTADKNHDDNTCRREQKIANRFGFTRYLKGNILDIMETEPQRIPDELQHARTPNNLVAISRMAMKADWIFLAYGNMPSRFNTAITETLHALFAADRPIACFQKTNIGFPSHTRSLLNRNIPDVLVDVRPKF